MNPGDSLLGYLHSHNFFKGDNVAPCDPKFVKPYDPDWAGGGSDQDWPFLTNTANQFEGYVVTPERMYYLPHNLTEDQWHSNPNRYNNQNYCAVR